MAKLRVTFDVETGELFDSLQKLNGDAGGIGMRLAGVMMTGEASFLDSVGMAVYGVALHKVEKLSDGQEAEKR